MTSGDFVTPLYGPFLHLNTQVYIEPMANPPLYSERTSQQYSAWLLARRFGNRISGWPYPVHVQKAHLKPIIHEARLMWAHAFENTTSHRWRAKGKMANSHMLSYSGLLMEQHREALLWSFFVARLDRDGDGTYSDEELRLGFNELGDERTNRESIIDVKMAVRHSALHGQWIKNLEQTNFPAPNATSESSSPRILQPVAQLFPRRSRLHVARWLRPDQVQERAHRACQGQERGS